MPEPCQKCGHQKELNVKSLIFQANIHEEGSQDSSFFETLDAQLEAISPDLCQEIRKQGTRHPLAGKTLTELKEIYASSESSD